jgi:acyl carrier protein
LSVRTAEEIQSYLVGKIAVYAQLPEDDIDAQAPFARFGLDSKATVMLTGELEEWLSLSLPPTLLWDYASIDAVVRHLASQVGGSR